VKVYLDVAGDVTAKTFRPASFRIYWWAFGRWLALIGLIGLVGTLFLRVVGAGTVVWAISLEVAVGALLTGALIGLLPSRVRRNRLNEGHFHLLAHEDGYTVEGPFGTQTFRWSTYKKAYRDKGFIYLMLTRRLAQIIPLSIVKDEEPLLSHLRSLGLLQPTPRAFFIV
jgi:YcxB-like protein